MTNTNDNDLSGFSLLDLFRTEVETQTQILNNGLLILEQNPAQLDGIEALMRASHSVKGAARIVQIDSAVKVAHAMEDCFVALQKGEFSLSPGQVDTLLKGVDWLTRISQLKEAEIDARLNELKGEIDTVIQTLRAIPTLPPAIPVTAPQSAAAKIEAEEKPTKPTAEKDNVVRITAQNLNRLMNLAGECLIQTGWLKTFSDSLLQFKARERQVAKLLESLWNLDKTGELPDPLQKGLTEALLKSHENSRILTDHLTSLENYSRNLGNLSSRLYYEVIASRMRPFSDGITAFPRLVRDLSKQLGKKVQLEISGKATEVDRDILEKLEAPLTHLLRNALDHGLELPAERSQAGKEEVGKIELAAVHRAGMLLITVSDDGRGISLDQLRKKVVEKGLTSLEVAQKLSEAELLEFLFLPGFSTATAVTEISGRGVGLDVVSNMVQTVGGLVRVESTFGKGCQFYLQLPITLSVTRTLIVEISGEIYAFPLLRVDRALNISRKDILTLENRQYISFENSNIGLINADEVLELPQSVQGTPEVSIVILSDRLNRYGLVVDRFLGERDLVVHPLDKRLGKITDLSSMALMEDGTPVLILDVFDMVRSIDNLLFKGRLRRVETAGPTEGNRPRKRILVVDDSLTVREVQRKLLENKGYEVELAVDGMRSGWAAMT